MLSCDVEHVDSYGPVRSEYQQNAESVKSLEDIITNGDSESITWGIFNTRILDMSANRSEPSLLEFLDLSQSNCLNEVEDYNLKSILASKIRNTSDAYLLSDTDEQLLLNIHFNQRVRIRSIVLHTASPQQGPKTIKLLVNRTAIGFEDVVDADEPEVAQVIEVPDDTVREGQPIDLRYVRFQSVNSLHIFVESNHGEVEQTRIDSIDIFGFPCGTTKDLSELKKQQDD